MNITRFEVLRMVLVKFTCSELRSHADFPGEAPSSGRKYFVDYNSGHGTTNFLPKVGNSLLVGTVSIPSSYCCLK